MPDSAELQRYRVTTVIMPNTKFSVDFFAALEKLGEPLPALWVDTFEFMQAGMKAKGRDLIQEQGFFRVAIVLASAAFEGFVNFIANEVVRAGSISGHKLTEFEIDCLSERRRLLEGGEIKEKRQIYSTRERYFLLSRLFGHGHVVTTDIKAKLDSSLKARDQIVHPKPGSTVKLDETAVIGFYGAAVGLFLVWEVSDLVGRDKRPLSDFRLETPPEV